MCKAQTQCVICNKLVWFIKKESIHHIVVSSFNLLILGYNMIKINQYKITGLQNDIAIKDLIEMCGNTFKRMKYHFENKMSFWMW